MEQPLGKILLVDDEPDILEILSFNLENEGYETKAVGSGVEAVSLVRIWRPELILLDVMMPDMDGFATLTALRKIPELEQTIIIFLTALADEKSEIEGLKMGADDYITKPIRPDLLLARLTTALRRVRKNDTEDNSLLFGDLQINKDNYSVKHKDKDIKLARKEFELLYLMAAKPGRVFLRTEILDKVWGTDVIVGDRTIDVHIRKIRQKVGLDIIQTVKGVGYKFEMPD